MPLSQTSPSPFICINAGQILARDIVEKIPIVVRMGSFCQRQYFFRRVGDKEFFTSNTDTFATITRIHFCGMGLQPGRVTIEPSPLRPGFRELFRVSDFFHDDLRRLLCRKNILLTQPLQSLGIHQEVGDTSLLYAKDNAALLHHQALESISVSERHRAENLHAQEYADSGPKAGSRLQMAWCLCQRRIRCIEIEFSVLHTPRFFCVIPV